MLKFRSFTERRSGEYFGENSLSKGVGVYKVYNVSSMSKISIQEKVNRTQWNNNQDWLNEIVLENLITD